MDGYQDEGTVLICGRRRGLLGRNDHRGTEDQIQANRFRSASATRTANRRWLADRHSNCLCSALDRRQLILIPDLPCNRNGGLAPSRPRFGEATALRTAT
jgi:hypothetical protein